MEKGGEETTWAGGNVLELGREGTSFLGGIFRVIPLLTQLKLIRIMVSLIKLV
jgi:hypothetical protein